MVSMIFFFEIFWQRSLSGEDLWVQRHEHAPVLKYSSYYSQQLGRGRLICLC